MQYDSLMTVESDLQINEERDNLKYSEIEKCDPN